MAAFILGPSAKADDDDFETEYAEEALDEEPTDVVRTEAPQAVHERARSVRDTTAASSAQSTPHPATVTSLEPRRRIAGRALSMSEIMHVRPYAFSEAAEIGESFKSGIPIILNLTNTDERQAQKLIDFAAGMAFVTDGKLEKITPRVFIIIPASVHLTEADRSSLAEAQQ
jgi:cell division inhibitor SepF